jgi:hypothetical protein
VEPTISIDELVLKARKFILDRGYKAEYRYAHHWIWKKFSQYAKKRRQSSYSNELGMEFYCNWLGYPSIAFTEKKNEFKYRAMMVLDDIFHDRPPQRKYSHKLIHIPVCFLTEYNAYLKYLTDHGQKPRTIETKVSRLLVFLRYLEKKPYMLHNFNFQAIEDFYGHISATYNKTTQANIKFTVRDFLKFGSAAGFVPSGAEKLIGAIYGNKHERLPSTYTKEEMRHILLATDRTTILGKRDYAMLVLLIQLGMRSSDICHLTLDSICPDEHSIVFIQQKTNGFQMLPITNSIELALADYLENARPETQSGK